MNPKAIKEFAQIYECEFGIKLPHEEVTLKANRFIQFFSRAIFLKNQQKGEQNDRKQ